MKKFIIPSVTFLAGCISATIVMSMTNKCVTIGDLVIDNSIKDEPPMIFMELDETVEALPKEGYVRLKVVHKNYLDAN